MSVTLIVGTDKGGFVFRSGDGRGDWSMEGPLFKGWKVTTSARTPGGRWLVGTASQVYGPALHVSDDLKEWRQVERGPAYPEGGDRKFQQIWTIRPAGALLYAGVDEAGLFTSADDGETWAPVSALNDHETRPAWFPGAGGLCAHHVLVDGTNPDRVWVGISAVGLWRTDDGGATWHPKNAGVRQVIEDKDHKDIGYCVHGVAHDPAVPDVIYRQDHTGFYVSRDGGDAWTPAMEGLPSWFGFPVARNPATGRLFVFPMESDEYRLPVDGRFRVYKSDDGAATWTPCGADGLPDAPTYAGVLRGALAADADGGVFVGTTSGGVYASADGGDSWRAMPATLPRVLSVAAYAG